jgi:hypothetical protein
MMPLKAPFPDEQSATDEFISLGSPSFDHS